MKRNDTLGHEAVRLTTSKVITMVITLITSMLLARFRSLEEYGTYSQLLLVINLFTTLLMLGLPNSINYFLARADTADEKKKFLSVYYSFSTLLSFLIGLILVLSVPIIESYFHNSNISKFYYFLAVYPWASIISSSIENVLVVYRKTAGLIIYRIVHSIALLGAILVIQWMGCGFGVYMLVFVIINCLFAIAVYLIAARLSNGLKPNLDKTFIRSILTFSVPMGLAAVVGTLNTEIDKLLIGFLMDTEQLAIYTNAAKELPLSIVGSSITAVLLPRMARLIKQDRSHDAIALWGVATQLSFIVIAVIVCGVFTYAEDVMTFLYSSKYLPGITVFRIYTLNLLLRVTYFGIVLNASGQTKKIFWCSILSLILNIILNPLFYYAFGMIGPAIATFLAILFIQLLQLGMTAKVAKVQIAEVFPWIKIIKIMMINICFSVVFFMLKHFIPLEEYVGSLVESILLGALWVGIYLFVMKNRIQRYWKQLNAQS